MCADDELDRRSECACFAIRNRLCRRGDRHTERDLDGRTGRSIHSTAELYHRAGNGAARFAVASVRSGPISENDGRNIERKPGFSLVASNQFGRVRSCVVQLSGAGNPEGFSYTFLSGRSYLVRAPSGFGKSTLLQLILGIHEPSSGRIVYNGKSGYTTDALLENIAWMPQSQELLHGTVEENITFSSVYQKMDRVAIDFKGNADILSGGQKQRVILNRILQQNKDWILLDEPTAGMDPGLQERVLRSILGSKKTCIMVMHTEEESVLSLFDEIIDLS